MKLVNRLSLFSKKYRHESIIVLVSLLAQLVVLFLFIWKLGSGKEAFLIGTGDPVAHFDLAMNLIKHRAFTLWTEPSIFPETLRMPLYPAFVALFYWLTNSSWFIILVQQIFAIISMVFLYRLGKLLFDPRIALIGTIIASVDTQRVFLAEKFSPEAMFGMFLIVAIYFVFKFTKQPRYLYVFIAGLCMGLGAMTRVIGFFLSFVLVGFILIYNMDIFKNKVKISWKKVVVAASIFLVTVVAVLTPWALRNYNHFGVFSFSSSGGYNVWSRHVRHYYEYQWDLVNEKEVVRGFLKDIFMKDNNLNEEDFFYDYRRDLRYSSYLKSKSMEILFADPLTYSYIYARRMVAFSLDHDVAGQAVMVNDYFYPILDTSGITSLDILYAGRYVWAAIYFMILLALILRFKQFEKYRLTFLLIVMWAGASAVMGCMSFGAKNRLYVDFFLYFVIIFSIIQLKEFVVEIWEKRKLRT